MYGRVARRRVFYVPGYDPVPARRYREIYRREGAAQARISGYDIALKPRHATGGPYGWHVSATIEGAEVETEVDILAWSDIVRDSMARGVFATYLQLARTAWTYAQSGAFRRLMRLRRGPVLAALYPVGMLLVQLAIAIAAGIALASHAAPVLPWEAAALAGLAVTALMLQAFQRLDRRLYAHYLMHDYAFTARHGGEIPPELDERLVSFREAIAAALKSDVDEVLVVGHSSGAHLAVSVLAELIRRGEVPNAGPALSLLTLGHVVPMVSFLPRAWQLRDDLHYLASRRELAWVDVTAPGDACAFALCDPVAVSGVCPKEKYWPLVVSAAFSQTLSRSRWRRLRWRFFRLHFQYLHAFDTPGDYDYFQITAGPKTLGSRFAGRPPSRSRIERSVSPYTSRAA